MEQSTSCEMNTFSLHFHQEESLSLKLGLKKAESPRRELELKKAESPRRELELKKAESPCRKLGLKNCEILLSRFFYARGYYGKTKDLQNFG